MAVRFVLALALIAAALVSAIHIADAAWAQWRASTPEGAVALPARAGKLARFAEGPEANAGRGAPLFRAELARAPMEDYPLAFAGLAWAASGDSVRAQAAMRAVVKRNPRNLWGRAAAAQDAASAGDFPGAVAHISALLALDGDNVERYVGAMAALAGSPAARPALRRALAGKPWWSDMLVRQLVKQSADADFTKQLARLTPSAQEATLQRTAAQDGYELAYFDWLSFFPGAPARVRWPYDGGFKGLPGAPPFNWRYDAAGAELAKGGGLYTKFFGRRSVDFATQTMLLGPGEYRLAADMSGDTRPRGAYFRWSVTCVGGAGSLAALDVARLEEKPRRWTAEFAVPSSGCDVQTVTLQGVAGELPLWARAFTTRVTIEQGKGAGP